MYSNLRVIRKNYLLDYTLLCIDLEFIISKSEQECVN